MAKAFKKGDMVAVDTGADGEFKLAEFIEKKGGWISVLMDEGIRKVRASAVSEAAGDDEIFDDVEGDDDTEALGSVIDPELKKRYVQDKTASGGATQHNGDLVAKALSGKTIDEAYKLGKKICGEDFRGRYDHLNVGMQRMNVGNRIRAAIKEDPELEAKLG